MKIFPIPLNPTLVFNLCFSKPTLQPTGDEKFGGFRTTYLLYFFNKKVLKIHLFLLLNTLI